MQTYKYDRSCPFCCLLLESGLWRTLSNDCERSWHEVENHTSYSFHWWVLKQFDFFFKSKTCDWRQYTKHVLGRRLWVDCTVQPASVRFLISKSLTLIFFSIESADEFHTAPQFVCFISCLNKLLKKIRSEDLCYDCSKSILLYDSKDKATIWFSFMRCVKFDRTLCIYQNSGDPHHLRKNNNVA